jgi:ribosomal protein S27AE
MEARYEERVRNCKTEDELAEYLLACMPVIREYTEATTTTVTTKTVANLQIASRKGVQRNDIYKKYLKEVEDEEVYEKKPEIDTEPCKNCGKTFTKIHDEQQSDMICTECGYTEYFLSEELGFKEEQEIEKNVVYSYKRENHFNEWISQFQAKESTSVPEEVIGQLRTEFRKMKIKNLDEITHEKVRALLKKLDKNKYYEHAPYIATILGGITPPTMKQDLEDKLRLMFHKIQAPFEKHKPAARKNFLSYSYVLYKMCELLSEDRYLPCFPLLKSKEKLYIQDQIWKKICEELEWEFIRTI